jgi:hypothetical protein
MLATMRKAIQASFLSYLVGSLVFVVLLLTLGQGLLHNHEPDLEHHHDCPAFEIYLIFSSVIVQYCLFFFVLICCAFVAPIEYFSAYLFFAAPHDPRAPPFQIPASLVQH